jgi:glycosyltransferase involved in cell wall biosynthesis
MRIGIDTLFERPDTPSSAIDYLTQMVELMPRVGPEHEYVVFTSPRNLFRFEALARPNVRFVNSWFSNENMPLRIAVQQSLLPAQIAKHRVDVLYSPGNVCPMAGRFCRVLKINTLHHYAVPELLGRARSAYRRLMFAASARRADHIIANTQETKREICRLMGVPDENVSVVFEASFSNYSPMPADETAQVCAKHGLTPGYILFVSQLFPYKNAETLIDAYAQLRRQGFAGELVLLGRDFLGTQAKLKAQVERLGIADSVRFLGFVELEDLPCLYCGASVFVYPSLMETFGKPLVEAMQCGVPIVAANTSCIPEVVGDAGLLVGAKDAAAMADAIRRAMDPATRAELTARGRQRASLFTYENTAKQTLEILCRTWEQRKSGVRMASAARAGVA